MKSLDSCTSIPVDNPESTCALKHNEYSVEISCLAVCSSFRREGKNIFINKVYTTIKNIYLTARRCKSFLDMSRMKILLSFPQNNL